jgi:PKD domain
MINNNKSLLFLLCALLVAGVSCKKEEYSFGAIKSPEGLTLTATVVGANAGNPNGNGSGNVTVTAAATNALSYKVDYGDGTNEMVPSGNVTHRYTNPGVGTYVVTVNAIGTAGVISSLSKTVTVFVAFEIPAAILQSLTNGSSKVWVTAKETPGHFGVGPSDQFAPIWYEAGPNTREPCAYDDEITFSKDANGLAFINVDNKGQSFSIGASSAFYGFSGGDACFSIATGGLKQLAFSDATTGSTAAVSTQIQFKVPGNGIINFGTGGVTYEILSITDNLMFLRNIGADGNSWYQKLKPKP